MTWSISSSYAASGAEQQPPNLVRNGSFEIDNDNNQVPDWWQAAGDRNVVQSLSWDHGYKGRCARLTCTGFRAVGPASHAMICQMGVPVDRGKTYRLRFWAKGEKIAGHVVSVALSDTSIWANCGLEGAFAPTARWKQYEFIFQATRTCRDRSRLQIWFTSTGTLWIDELVLEEVKGQAFRPGNIIPAGPRVNLIPNASFECGTYGWGSEALDRIVHWGGGLNRLVGSIDDETTFHGKASLQVTLSGDNCPISFFDYYELYRTPILAPLVGNIGFIEVEPGKQYVFSFFAKADSPGVPLRAAVREFGGRLVERSFLADTRWRRFVLPFRAGSRWCYVLAGPDLRPTSEHVHPPDEATVWLDAFQLELGEHATTFETRMPLEIGIETEKLGNIFTWSEPVRLRLLVANSDNEEHTVNLECALYDFFDAEILRRQLSLVVPANCTIEKTVDFPPSETLRGFFRAKAKLKTPGHPTETAEIRGAVIPEYSGKDSRFGVNHAYPWNHLLELCRKAGLLWVRDWSCKWQQVEPTPGRFDFSETDYQIDRPLSCGLKVLAMLPFPSAHWSSSAPPDYKLTESYTSRRERVAYAPKDPKAFQNYVFQTVAHYKNRVTWWQVFNEPIFTTYALPRRFGYTAADYAKWTKLFAEAARKANPNCRILAGIGYLNEGQIMDDWQMFLSQDVLPYIDAVDIHHYPKLRPPEFIEHLLAELNSLMESHGGRKPIWLTEYGYYADDDPTRIPMQHSAFDTPLDNEVMQAAYAVRWAVICIAGGVEKIFYHAGTCDTLNRDSLQGIFFEYGGTPHKIYAAQAVLSHLLTPQTVFYKRCDMPSPVRCYLFGNDKQLVGAIWSTDETAKRILHLRGGNIKCWDIMGRPVHKGSIHLTEIPLWLIAEDMSPDQFLENIAVSQATAP